MTIKSKSSRLPLLAYSDESGVPGTASSENDWFLVAMVFFRDKNEVCKVGRQMAELRKDLSLPANYKFHKVEDPKSVQRAFYDLISKLDFMYYAFAIEKNQNKLASSEITMSRLIVKGIRPLGRVHITIDRNPKLYLKLCKEKKNQSAIGLHFEEQSSRKSDCLQVADYVTAYEILKLKEKRAYKWASYKAIDRKRKAIIFADRD